MDVLAAVFALQVQELHHHLVGVAVVDLALQKDDAVLQQQVAQRHLPLALIVAVIDFRINAPAVERKGKVIAHRCVSPAAICP